MRKHRTWILGLFAAALLAACGAEPASEAPADEAAETSSEVAPAAPSKASAEIVLGEFRAAGRMTDGRGDHDSALLPDGRVLSAGGRGGESHQFWGANRIDTAEIYDPAVDEWTPTGSMAKKRESLTLSALGDGRVLATGGRSEQRYHKQTEIWDPDTGTWSKSPNMKTPRWLHTAVDLPDGTVMVIGGTDDIYALVSGAEIFDPATDTWTPAGKMAQARALHTATLLPDGRILVVGGGKGGVGTDTEPFDTAEIWDPNTNSWTSAGTMATTRAQHIAALLPDGRVLIAGSVGKISSAEIWDPSTGTWSSAGSMSTWRAQHTATMLGSGQVLVTGGIGRVDPTTEIFDSATGTWSLGSKMTEPRYAHSTIALGDGRVLLSGGQTENQAGERKTSNTAEVYEP